MSEIAGQPGTAAQGEPHKLRTAHEAYSFACMRCGHGWEQSYEIEHHVDFDGEPYVTYLANGVRVPSPLSRPTCLNCGGHVVRIMRPGRVSSAQSYLVPHEAEGAGAAGAVPRSAGTAAPTRGIAESVPAAGPVGQVVPSGSYADDETSGEERHRHLSDLLHPFRHRPR